jgi:C-terminal processing protease CtpA/Prc
MIRSASPRCRGLAEGALGSARAAIVCVFVVFASTRAGAQPPAPVGADAHIDRLARVARLWGTVHFLHPYLAYKPIDWDAALVTTIPRIRDAKTAADYRMAVQHMLDALDDPVTRVLDPAPDNAAEPSRTEAVRSLFHTVEGGVVVVDLAPFLSTAVGPEVFRQVIAAKGALAGASAVVIDLRAGHGTAIHWAEYVVDDLAGALVSRPMRGPAQRYRLHSGYRHQAGSTSGGYYSGFLHQSAATFAPQPEQADVAKRVVFVLDRHSRIPAVALALQASGEGRLVVEGQLDETQIVATRHVDLGEGVTARIRTSELIPFAGWRGLRADVESPERGGAATLRAAASQARTGWPASASDVRADVDSLPDPIYRRDPTYAEMSQPALEYRQLAVIRAWNVIHWFYPYLSLIGDWDAVLPEFLARMDVPMTGRDYALAMLEMMTRVPDGHTSLWGRPDVSAPFGDTGLPIQVRWIEGSAVAVRVSAEVERAGLERGDAIRAVDGESVAARIDRLRKYMTASTPASLRYRIGRTWLFAGEAGSTAVLTVEKLDGTVREVRLVRDPKSAMPPPASGEVIRILPGNWGYVDLTRLTVADVPELFEKVEATRGLIMDMRGYPQGTAWSIAPRINTRKASVGALFRRRQVGAFSEEEGEAGYYFSQPLPPLAPGDSLYARPTVMLIDERAISQSEHSGLFFEAASGTMFVGTPTAGANGDVTAFSVPGGIWIGFTGHDVRHADGRQLQRVGLVPHVEAAPTRAGIAAGRDEVLDRAVQHLEETARP